MDHKDLCNHTRIKLIASAIGHQQCTKTASNIIPLPGTDRVIAIGTPAEVLGLLGSAPLTAPAPLTDELKRERDSFERMFLAACADLGLVNEALGLDPDDGGADPILEAIEELKTKAAAVQFDADELRKLILNVSNTSHWCGAIGGDADDYAVALAKANAADEALFSYVKNLAAPAPQQSESIDSIANELEDAAIPYEGDFADTVRSCVEGLRDLAAAKAAPAAPVQTAEPKRIPDMLTVETIQGAIAFGRMGINPPPSPDHWGNEFWQIGRQLAKLGETSAWDNVTPVDVAAPVQADQAQAEQAAAVRAAYENAARICDSVNNHDNPMTARDCADAIRALAAPSTATSNDTGALGDTGGGQ